MRCAAHLWPPAPSGSLSRINIRSRPHLNPPISSPSPATGSQPLNWRGSAFPHLPSWLRPREPETYADARAGGHGHGGAPEQAEEQAHDRTGTWNGPAPRGYVAQPTHVSSRDYIANGIN